MKWTKTKPTVDAFYFVKCFGQLSDKTHDTVVKVYRNAKAVFYDGETFDIDDSCFHMWSDQPIDPPNAQDQRGGTETVSKKENV